MVHVHVGALYVGQGWSKYVHVVYCEVFAHSRYIVFFYKLSEPQCSSDQHLSHLPHNDKGTHA